MSENILGTLLRLWRQVLITYLVTKINTAVEWWVAYGEKSRQRWPSNLAHFLIFVFP